MGMACKGYAIVEIVLLAVILATSVSSCVSSLSGRDGRSGHMIRRAQIARTTERSLLQESKVAIHCASMLIQAA